MDIWVVSSYTQVLCLSNFGKKILEERFTKSEGNSLFQSIKYCQVLLPKGSPSLCVPYTMWRGLFPHTLVSTTCRCLSGSFASVCIRCHVTYQCGFRMHSWTRLNIFFWLCSHLWFSLMNSLFFFFFALVNYYFLLKIDSPLIHYIPTRISPLSTALSSFPSSLLIYWFIHFSISLQKEQASLKNNDKKRRSHFSLKKKVLRGNKTF